MVVLKSTWLERSYMYIHLWVIIIRYQSTKQKKELSENHLIFLNI